MKYFKNIRCVEMDSIVLSRGMGGGGGRVRGCYIGPPRKFFEKLVNKNGIKIKNQNGVPTLKFCP
jgi:hypothetical protein